MGGSSWREPSRYVQRHIAPFEKANINARRRTALHGGRAPKIRRKVGLSWNRHDYAAREKQRNQR
jgi:hypothetical protein